MNYLATETDITFHLDGEIVTVQKSHPNAISIRKAIQDDDLEALRFAVKEAPVYNVESIVNEELNDVVEIRDGKVFYNGEELHNVLSEIMVKLKAEGFNMDNYIEFLKNLMQNPSYNSRQQLYSFIEDHKLPITEDGCILAYKGVNDDYTDRHTGTFDNSVGAVHKMPREKVDDNPNNSCSYGFHVGSQNYATNFGARTVIVKVNPRDVVSVPNNETDKCRCCRYEVVQDYSTTLDKACYAADGTDAVRDFEESFIAGDKIIFDYETDGEVKIRSIFITNIDTDNHIVTGELLPSDPSFSYIETRYRNFHIEDMEDVDVL